MRTIFVSIVRAVAADHFSTVDRSLLVEYARAAHQADVAAAKLDLEGAVVDGKASPWLTVQEKSVRALVALSARLRICPQSRFDRMTAGKHGRPQPDEDGAYDPRDPLGLLAGNRAHPAPRRPKTGLASFR